MGPASTSENAGLCGWWSRVAVSVSVEDSALGDDTGAHVTECHFHVCYPSNAGLSEAMLGSGPWQLGEMGQKYMKTIKTSSLHLSALINDILDAAAATKGKLAIKLEKVCPLLSTQAPNFYVHPAHSASVGWAPQQRFLRWSARTLPSVHVQQ